MLYKPYAFIVYKVTRFNNHPSYYSLLDKAKKQLEEEVTKAQRNGFIIENWQLNLQQAKDYRGNKTTFPEYVSLIKSKGTDSPTFPGITPLTLSIEEIEIDSSTI